MSATTTASSATVSGSSYTAKQIDVTITLGEGAFGTTGKNTVKLSGLRVVASILKAGAPSFDKAEIRVFGVPDSIANAVTTLGVPLTMYRPNNTILIEAGDAVNGMAIAFQGTIWRAWQDFDGAPENYLQFVSWSGAQTAAMTPAQPTSVQNQTDVASTMAAIAKQAGFAFENNGVSVQLASTYLPGSAMDQMHRLADAAQVQLYVDSSTNPNTVVIWPRNQTRTGTTPLISPASGLIGYPKHRDQGMSFRCLFNPSIKLGGTINVQSSLKPACGKWMVIGPYTHNISAQMPQGPWFSEVNCARTSEQLAAA